MKLEGKVAIITGAGSGMGAEEAKMFAAEGARVVITDINAEACRKVADEIGEGRSRSSMMSPTRRAGADPKSVVRGKSVSVRVELGGRSCIKKKKTTNTTINKKTALHKQTH